ncbi:hypothetical protein B9Z51_12170 [Limnohabitans sp. T6-5]|uniref:hypothetical protein n=1 Tax=Limnohabitans sp. T6-5 TaxID=1100724 RepID=UPI000D3A15AD|nr:hypothetical protein [Limnohabitans sp. T6-5]PUE06701.1 hypothetical protein B9Z51_12170 [Limnohabitans sp. T6-5]
MRFRQPTHFLLSLMAIAALSACGGGSSSTPDQTNNNTDSADTQVSAAATSNASAMGAELMASGVYDLMADIGDTWRVTLNTNNNTFTLKVVSTAYGLRDLQGTISAGTATGSRTSYTLQTGGSDIGKLTTDSSTQSVSGNLKIGNKEASVSGTAYKATALSKLAGTYNFMMASRDAVSGGSLDFGVGQIRIAADGTRASLCRSGQFVSDICTSVGGSTPQEASVALSLDSNGLITFANFGKATVIASNLGKALTLDMNRTNEEGYLRTGVWYLSEVKSLSESAINGNWTCNLGGQSSNTLAITGTSVTGAGLGNVTTGKVKYNNINHTDNTWFPWAGFAAGGATTDPVSDYSLVLPLSATLVVMEWDGRIRVCNKNGSN